MAGTPELKAASAKGGTEVVPFAGPLQELTNYETLVARTIGVFGDELKASRWLSLPNADLNGESPLQVAQRNHYSSLLLEPILTRIEHGIDA